jgi:MscS family membrane protein
MPHFFTPGAAGPSRRRAPLLALFAWGLIVIAGAGPAAGQPAPAPEPSAAPPTVADFSKPMGPADPFNRGTPRGTMYGFIVACRAGDHERAANYLDLRRLSPEEQEQGPRLARQLKAVLDQKLWVDFATLSDRNDGFADDGLEPWQERLTDIETQGGLVTLLLQRVPREGDKVRIWKISATTVDRIPELYDEFGPVWLEHWLPPVFFEKSALNLALWQWLGIVVLLLAGGIVSLLLSGSLVRLLGAVFTRRGQTIDERIVRVVRGPVRLTLTVLLFEFGRRYLALGPSAEAWFRLVERLLLVTAAAWLTFRVIDIAGLGIRSRALRRGNMGLLPVLQPLQLFSKVVVVVIGALGVLGTLGVDVTAAVAGLGVGGIAVALAAQKTLENLFGGISLFADRPVRVGDFFKYGDQLGTVEEIGLRSTRVRTLDRTLISIPNGEFSNMPLENYTRRDRMRLWTLIGVRYETTPEQIRFLLARMREILLAHPRVTDDPARVRFVGFGAYSLDLEVFAYVDTADWSELLGIREDIYLRFMDAVSEAGTSFAFPSSTMYLGKDEGLDADEARRAEARVAEWREQGRLPFPHFPEELRGELENTLDWPPKGSPGRPPSDRDDAP